MSIARRTLLTTTAAGTLLCALWFVPSANATDGAVVQQIATVSSRSGEAVLQEDEGAALLADTGTGTDTAPYLIGGTAFLALGAGFVTYSVRRSPGRVAF